MAELQYVHINQSVLPHFCAYDSACLLSHLFKLNLFMNLNVGEPHLFITMLYNLFVFSLCVNLL